GDTLYILEATDDDIINKQQALISKAMRTIGLRLIPGDIVDECMEAVIETQRNADAEDPDAAKRKLFDAFGQLGVRAEQIKEYLGHDASTLPPKEMTDLRALYASIRDGEATWRDVMENNAENAGAPPPPAGKKEIPACTSDSFDKKKAGWKKTVENGIKSVNELIATIQTKELLTDDQKVEIASWAVKQPTSEGAAS
ncbi:MAG: uncharacterized protein JWQ94_4951, partial [Tardiphaga sp.]|nr:uncharacterized protein [Tardiphaga sp.]